MEYKLSEKERKYSREYARKWRDKNKEKSRKYSREYMRERYKRNTEYHKKWIEKNREHWNKYNRERRKGNKKYHEIATKRLLEKLKNNDGFRLSFYTSNAMYKALKRNKAGKHWETLVGYTIKDLMTHLESQFDENMFWHNYGSYWHLDHIKPQSLFNFTTPEDKEFKECWALDNLQPLEAKANMRKSNKYAILDTGYRNDKVIKEHLL